MRCNEQYFVVQIDKEAQNKKRQNIPTENRPYLGIKFADNTVGLKGIKVLHAEAGSPGSAAGFKPNDIILGINDTEIGSPEQVIDLIWKYQPGEKINVTYYDSFDVKPKKHTKEVQLGSKAFTLVLPEEFNEMRFNLQYGEIVQIGEMAHDELPEAQEGDILIFSHQVEYKPRDTEDLQYNDWHLVEILENNDELRVVNAFSEVFGVMKLNGDQPVIIPHKDKIFCHQHFTKSSLIMKDGVYMFDKWEQSMEEIQIKIDELHEQIISLSSSTVFQVEINEQNYRLKEELQKAIVDIQKERAELTKKMHKKKLMELKVMWINPKTVESFGFDVKIGDFLLVDFRTLYPLDIGGAYYTIVTRDFVDSAMCPDSDWSLDIQQILKQSNMKQKSQKKPDPRPLYDMLLVKQDEAPTVTESGIIIPDTAREKPNRGTVIAVGLGIKKEELWLEPGDRILFGKGAGTEYDIDGEILIHMTQKGVIMKL